jgi:hypothetical protein
MAYRHLEKDSFDATITSLCLFCFGSCVVLCATIFFMCTHTIHTSIVARMIFLLDRRWPKEFKYYLSIFP